MKILQINKFFYKRGGAEAYMFNLSSFLRQQGHRVIEFSMQHPQNQESSFHEYFIENVELSARQGIFKDLKTAFHLLYSFEAKKKLEQLIKKEKPDIAHLHNFYFHLTPSILSVLKKYKIPIVWTMHDYKLICPNYKLFTQGQVCERCKVYKYYNCAKYKCIKNNRAFSFLAALESYLHNWLLKSYDQIDLYISPSKFLKSKVEKWGIGPEKVKQLYNFVDLAQFQPKDNIGNGLLYFGRLSEEKGLMVLLETMKSLPEIDLQIVGDGPQKSELEDYIKIKQLKNVQLIPHTIGQPLHDLIRNSRFVILPSIWYENNPISVLEAFALQKPVIGSDLGGIPELVKTNETGILFEAGKASDLQAKIKENYFNTEKALIMGKNARVWVENNCQPSSHYEHILKLYQCLIKA